LAFLSIVICLTEAHDSQLFNQIIDVCQHLSLFSFELVDLPVLGLNHQVNIAVFDGLVYELLLVELVELLSYFQGPIVDDYSAL
jgi:hypothetical protein